MKKDILRLSREGALKVIALIENPPRPNRRLRLAVKAFKASVRE
jgi:hypothetical protein